jgi:hypothetical protein
MVGREGPSFPTFARAFSAFFYDQRTQTGASQPTLDEFIVRIVDGRGRIKRVLARAASLDVWVDGRSLRGCRLEFNGSTERLQTVLERSGKVSFPLSGGLGQDPWVWLKDDEGWVDFRSLTPWGGRQSPDVEIELPEDPEADISALASQGESTYLEYKVGLPEDNQESKRKALKTVVAFANGEGGTMIFGVEGDDDIGRIVGLAGRRDTLRRQLNDLIRDRVSPNPRTHITGHAVGGKFIMRLDVEPGHGVLHALMMNPSRAEYYVRRNGSTYDARPDELQRVVVSAGRQSQLEGVHRLL